MIGFHASPSFSKWLELYENAKQNSELSTVEQKISAICEYLDHYFTLSSSMVRPVQRSQCDGIQVLCCLDDYSWAEQLLSVYAERRGRCPHPHEVLLCDHQTTEEDLSLLLQRARMARNNPKTADDLYCILHPEHLSFTLRSRAPEMVNTFLQIDAQNNQKPQTNLFIIVKAMTSPFVWLAHTLFAKCPPQQISQAISQRLKENQTAMHLFYSERCGDGKTFVIRDRIKRTQRENSSSRSVPFYPSTSMSLFIRNMDSSFSSVVHMNVVRADDGTGFEHSHKDIDMTLFKFFILGQIKDNQGLMYSIPHNSAYFLEIQRPADLFWRAFIQKDEDKKSSVAVPLGPFLDLFPLEIIDSRNNQLQMQRESLEPILKLMNQIRRTKPSAEVSLLSDIGLSSVSDKIGIVASLLLLSRFALLLVDLPLPASSLEIALQQLVSFCRHWFLGDKDSYQVRSWDDISLVSLPVITNAKSVMFLSNLDSAAANRDELFKSLENCTTKELQDLLSDVFGVSAFKLSNSDQKAFALTADNVAKLCLMKTFVDCGIPVIMMGETGCGKTFLVTFFARLLDCVLITLDMHGGITEGHIIALVDKATKYSKKGHRVILFLDEINTSTALYLVKELLCDKTCRGKSIGNISVVAACNPYRKINTEALQSQFATPLTDGKRSITYQVTD